VRTPREVARVTAAALLLTVAACEPGGNLPLLESSGVDSGYKLSTGDQVRLITFNEQTLSGNFSIDDSGYIALPLLGPVPADGLTTRALAKEIEDSLRARKLLSEPSVVVEIVRYRPIFVLGEVKSPGPFPYQPHMTMLTAVALAGGFTPRAVKSRAEVVRTGAGASVDGRLDPQSKVDPGDVITVLERNF
jgi:polysaccharide export outer membrane protein